MGVSLATGMRAGEQGVEAPGLEWIFPRQERNWSGECSLTAGTPRLPQQAENLWRYCQFFPLFSSLVDSYLRRGMVMMAALGVDLSPRPHRSLPRPPETPPLSLPQWGLEGSGPPKRLE